MAPHRPLPQFGRYECREYLGGGMSDVYKAFDTMLKREVVLKVLTPEASNDREQRERFQREAELACRCRHDYIVQTYDVGEYEGRPYMVIELLHGEPLRSLMDRHGLGDRERMLRIAWQLAAALEYIHGLDIIHRDIKPANVYIEDTGRVKLIDFGIARTSEWNLTQAGMTAGTLRYMAPEQMMGKPGRGSDIYAFGVLLFEMLTGQSVSKGETIGEISAWILNQTPDLTPLSACAVPEGLTQLIADCLEKNPEQRPKDFGEVRARLSAFVTPSSPSLTAVGTLIEPARPAPTATQTAAVAAPQAAPRGRGKLVYGIAGAVLLVALAAGVWWVLSRKSAPPTPAPTPAEPVAAPSKFLDLPSGGMVLVEGGPAKLGKDGAIQQVAAFYIDKTEVSNGAYLQYCRATQTPPPPSAEKDPADWPVVNVSFTEAQAFAKWAGKRLPTAHEWEKAARGSNGQEFPWGGDLTAAHANLGSAKGKSHPDPVDSHADGVSPYGTLNMVGNVWEWVDTDAHPEKDEYDFLAQQKWAKLLSPPLAPTEPYRQIRGGSYLFLRDSKESDLPSLVYDRGSLPVRVGRPEVGFRCAK